LFDHPLSVVGLDVRSHIKPIVPVGEWGQLDGLWTAESMEESGRSEAGSKVEKVELETRNSCDLRKKSSISSVDM